MVSAPNPNQAKILAINPIPMQRKNYYKILGIDRNATQEAIKSAYRRLARRYHPDISSEKNAEDRFKELREAYEALKDPRKREAYDRLGDPWQTNHDFRRSPGRTEGFGFARREVRSGFRSRIGELSESLWSFVERWRFVQKVRHWFNGRDHHAKLRIDLIDSYRGAQRRIKLRIPLPDKQHSLPSTERVLDVRIPKGVRAGQRIRLAGQGMPGIRGGRNGDLYLEVEFKTHPLFTVEGSDVHLTLPIAPWEAALGGSVTIPTPEDPIELKIPAGSGQGSRVRIKDRGIPGSPNGHLYVTLEVALPPADSEKARRLYRHMAREFTFNPRSGFGDTK